MTGTLLHDSLMKCVFLFNSPFPVSKREPVHRNQIMGSMIDDRSVGHSSFPLNQTLGTCQLSVWGCQHAEDFNKGGLKFMSNIFEIRRINLWYLNSKYRPEIICLKSRYKWVFFSLNGAISQIAKCTCSISHNVALRTEMCTFLFWMVLCPMRHCGICELVQLTAHWHPLFQRSYWSIVLRWCYQEVATKITIW